MSTPEERLAVLETLVSAQADEMDDIKEQLKDLAKKADQILSYARWGQGAVWAVLKIAGVLAAIGAAVAWLYDRFMVGPHP